MVLAILSPAHMVTQEGQTRSQTGGHQGEQPAYTNNGDLQYVADTERRVSSS